MSIEGQGWVLGNIVGSPDPGKLIYLTLFGGQVLACGVTRPADFDGRIQMDLHEAVIADELCRSASIPGVGRDERAERHQTLTVDERCDFGGATHIL